MPSDVAIISFASAGAHLCLIGVLLATLGWGISRDRGLLAGSRNFCGGRRAGFLAAAARLRGAFGRFAH